MEPAAAPDLSVVPIVQLEAIRLRLSQLVHSLNKLQAQVQLASLPSWSVLQQQFNVILTQLTALSNTLTNSSEIFQKTVTYPLGEFPTAEQAGLLTTLLRKKNLPEVDEWIREGETSAKDVNIAQDQNLCSWANQIVGNEIENHQWSGFLTRKQTENGEIDQGMARSVEEISNPKALTMEEIIGFASKAERPFRFLTTKQNAPGSRLSK